MALGNDRFKEELASLTGRRLQALPSGRKLGWRKINLTLFLPRLISNHIKSEDLKHV
jgi:hypothetical protein